MVVVDPFATFTNWVEEYDLQDPVLYDIVIERVLGNRGRNHKEESSRRWVSLSMVATIDNETHRLDDSSL